MRGGASWVSSLPRLLFSKERRRLLKRVNLMNSTILRNSLLVLIKTNAGNESSFAIIIDKVQACVAMTPMYRNSSAEDFNFRAQEMPSSKTPAQGRSQTASQTLSVIQFWSTWGQWSDSIYVSSINAGTATLFCPRISIWVNSINRMFFFFLYSIRSLSGLQFANTMPIHGMSCWIAKNMPLIQDILNSDMAYQLKWGLGED